MGARKVSGQPFLLQANAAAAPLFSSFAELAALSALRAAHNTDVALSEHAQLWEYQRVVDMKLALQQWVLSELSVHCAAVEQLSATAALLGAVDPNVAMLRCCNVGECLCCSG